MAILKAKNKTTVASENTATQANNLKKVATKLAEAIGRPPENATEERKRAATAAVMSGNSTFAEAERMYAISQEQIRRYINRTFPQDEDKYAFLESCMLANAMLAGSRFNQCFGELNAIDAARAMAIFSGKAIEIKKAREAGFKEAPINVTTIVALEKTLRNLTAPVPVTIDQ